MRGLLACVSLFLGRRCLKTWLRAGGPTAGPAGFLVAGLCAEPPAAAAGGALPPAGNAWPRCAEAGACNAARGGPTCSRRPASTLMPVILFQRRRSVSEMPKRSAMVTSVSPRRAV